MKRKEPPGQTAIEDGNKVKPVQLHHVASQSLDWDLLDKEDLLIHKSNTTAKPPTNDSATCDPQSQSVVTNDSICVQTVEKGVFETCTRGFWMGNSCTPLLREEHISDSLQERVQLCSEDK